MENTRKYLLKTICLVAAAMLLSLLPAVIAGGGILTLRDDFNYQQIIFSIQESSFFKSGTLAGWDFTTDLGSDILTSYTFYGLTSPFVLVLALLPAAAIPYALAPMIILKVIVAAITAFFYIKRFVKKLDTAVLGATLYALSGFQTTNLFFPFYDITATFPLLLIAVEEVCLLYSAKDNAVEKRECFIRYGALALACCLMSFTNYFFFFGEVVFTVLYFIFRFLISNDVLKTAKQKLCALLHCLVEGIVGTLMSAVVLLPSALAVLENPRVSDINSWPLFHWTNYISIIQAYLLPADVMGSQRYFIENGCTSCSVYLPFAGLAFVITYIICNKKSSLTWFMGVLTVFSLFPLLNGVFSLFNRQYYARWFFMFSLMMALATAIVLDMSKPCIRRSHMVKGAAINAIIVCGFCICLCLLGAVLAITNHPYATSINLPVTAGYCAIGGLASIGVLLIVYKMRKRSDIVKYMTVGVLVVAIISNMAVSIRYKLGATTSENPLTGVTNIDGPLSTKKTIEIIEDFSAALQALPEGDDFRINTSYSATSENYYWHSYDNISMVSGIPSVNSFISTVSGSIFRFYNGLGIERRVTSFVPDDDAFFALLSCKYYISDEKKTDVEPVLTYTYSDNTQVFVYEYENFIPMGFVYSEFITESELATLPEEIRSYALLNYVVLPDNSAAVNGLTHIGEEALTELTAKTSFTSDELSVAASARAQESSTKFTRANNSFTSTILSANAGLAYFSVPYSKGWSATVNGTPVTIIESNGMMCVPLTTGANSIEFTYKTPGLNAGILISAAATIVAFSFILISIRLRKKCVSGDSSV